MFLIMKKLLPQIMILCSYIPLPYHRKESQSLKYAIENDGVDLNRTKIRTMLLKDGIGTLNIDELMLMLNSHKKYESSLHIFII